MARMIQESGYPHVVHEWYYMGGNLLIVATGGLELFVPAVNLSDDQLKILRRMSGAVIKESAYLERCFKIVTETRSREECVLCCDLPEFPGR